MAGNSSRPGHGGDGGCGLSPLSQANIPQFAPVTLSHRELESSRAITTVLCTAVLYGQ